MNANDYIEIRPSEDFVSKGKKRLLPVHLTEEEFREKAKLKAAKEIERAQLEEALSAETKRRKQEITNLENEIEKLGVEVHTEAENRPVIVDEVWRDGNVIVVRRDVSERVETRAPTMQEAQRFLPGAETVGGPAAGILDQAAAAQAAADAKAGEGDAGTEESDAKPKRKKAAK